MWKVKFFVLKFDLLYFCYAFVFFRIRFLLLQKTCSVNFFCSHDSSVTVLTPSPSPPFQCASSMPSSNYCAAAFVCVCLVVLSSLSWVVVTPRSLSPMAARSSHSLPHSFSACNCCVPLCFLLFVFCFCDSLTCSGRVVALVITNNICWWLADLLVFSLFLSLCCHHCHQ